MTNYSQSVQALFHPFSIGNLSLPKRIAMALITPVFPQLAYPARVSPLITVAEHKTTSD
ncbi:2,4-dienoyl-CoA reductase-like NADH-dependent reductase (Old Yellow Enzyme family) [Kroppenstedtia sanguinis]